LSVSRVRGRLLGSADAAIRASSTSLNVVGTTVNPFHTLATAVIAASSQLAAVLDRHRLALDLVTGVNCGG